jgi:hypothetical protein
VDCAYHRCVLVRRFAVLSAVLLLASGCGSPGSVDDLFGEYVRSTSVANDPYGSPGATSEDRLAQFASMGTPQAVLKSLLIAHRCESGEGTSDTGHAPLGDGYLYCRRLLVKHGDGTLALVTVYVIQENGKPNSLLDADGRIYTDLSDFRGRNELFNGDDTILTFKDITAVPGQGEIVTVSGHTASIWLRLGRVGLAVLVVVVVLVAVAAVVGRIRNRRDERRLLDGWGNPAA